MAGDNRLTPAILRWSRRPLERMATILIITASYPYLPGEQFLEREIDCWSNSGHDVIIFPAVAAGRPRPIPPNIAVNLDLAKFRTRSRKAAYLARAIWTRLFVNEARYLLSVRNLKLRTLYQAARFIAQALLTEQALERIVEKIGRADLVYTYWNDTEAIGAALVKRRSLVSRVVSRAHGFDVVEERRPHQYMPVKRQFAHDFDTIFTNSQYVKTYLVRQYDFSPDTTVVSRLGVPLPTAVAPPSPVNEFRVASVSFCVRVKRIDKIVHAIRAAALAKPEIAFAWTHIGGGPLLEELTALAAAELGALPNVTVVFTGTLPNELIVAALTEQPCDLFVHASESEGLGVALMEAMSAGIPVLAPAVGGVPELVDADRGYLMQPNPSALEIGQSLVAIMDIAKSAEVRQNARRFVERACDAEVLYRAFVAECTSAL